MKKIIITTVCFFTVSIYAAFASSYILPSGGKDGNYWKPGTNQNITWSKFFLDTNKNLDIYLWNADSSSLTQIGSNIISTSESYIWNIPNNQVLGENFKIKITYTNDTTDFYLLSDDFFPISNENQPQINNIQIFDLNSDNSVQVYPNPATSGLVTVSSDDKFFRIEIYDNTGQLVFNSNNFEYTNSKNISTSNLSDGIYSIKIKFLGAETLAQFVVAR